MIIIPLLIDRMCNTICSHSCWNFAMVGWDESNPSLLPWWGISNTGSKHSLPCSIQSFTERVEDALHPPKIDCWHWLISFYPFTVHEQSPSSVFETRSIQWNSNGDFPVIFHAVPLISHETSMKSHWIIFNPNIPIPWFLVDLCKLYPTFLVKLYPTSPSQQFNIGIQWSPPGC